MIKCRVTAFHDESNVLDCVSMKDGRRFGGVPIMCSNASGNTGKINNHTPTKVDLDDQYATTNKGLRDIFCFLDFVDRDVPVVVGFMYPEVSQMHFKTNDFSLNRHGSDVYHTVDGQGNAEFYHPSGTYLRVGETTQHVDLTGKDYDKLWNIANNTDKAPSIHLEIANNGGTKTVINCDPNGNVTVTTIGKLTISSTGDMTLATDGNLAIASKGNIGIAASGNVGLASSGGTSIKSDSSLDIGSSGGMSIISSGGMTIDPLSWG